MKKLILSLIAVSLFTACGSSSPEAVKLPENLPGNEKPRESREKFKKLKNFDVSSSGGDVAIAKNPGGLEVVAGDLGVWVNGVPLKVDLGTATTRLDLDINSEDQWIAAGNKGVFYNGKLVKNVRLGNEGSDYAVSINNKGQWIAAGNGRVFIKRAGNPGVVKNLNVVNGTGNVTAKIFDDGSWVIASDMGVWTSAEPGSDDDSSLQSDQAEPFRPLSASQ